MAQCWARSRAGDELVGVGVVSRSGGRRTWQEGERRAEIREVRWQEVKREAFTKVSYERNASRLRDEIAGREAAAAMREYAGEVDAEAATLDPDSAQGAREWADWIREHAERTDPIHGPL